MAHFAELDSNNVVLRVIVVDNINTQDVNGVEREDIGVEFCKRLFGGTWKQTSYNKKIRKHYAGIGFSYDSELDAFLPPKPFASWVLNSETFEWETPIAMPTDGKVYNWEESTLSWQEVTSEE